MPKRPAIDYCRAYGENWELLFTMPATCVERELREYPIGHTQDEKREKKIHAFRDIRVNTLQVKFLVSMAPPVICLANQAGVVQEFLPSRTGVPPLFAARTVNREARKEREDF